MPNTIEAQILTRNAAGEDTLIPKIALISSYTYFKFKRLLTKSGWCKLEEVILFSQAVIRSLL